MNGTFWGVAYYQRLSLLAILFCSGGIVLGGLHLRNGVLMRQHDAYHRGRHRCVGIRIC